MKRRTKTRSTTKTQKKIFFKRRHGCPLSGLNAPEISYKDPELLKKYISESGRILPSRITNVCAKKQRELKTAIKNARMIGLLPFVFKIK
jgi:small subunit ribosomal protein S18